MLEGFEEDDFCRELAPPGVAVSRAPPSTLPAGGDPCADNIFHTARVRQSTMVGVPAPLCMDAAQSINELRPRMSYSCNIDVFQWGWSRWCRN